MGAIVISGTHPLAYSRSFARAEQSARLDIAVQYSATKYVIIKDPLRR
jgi:hypothetical protein